MSNNHVQTAPVLSPLTAAQRQQLVDLPSRWVTTQEQLFNLLDEIDTCEHIALDTEFIKRDTFYPILALVQVNTGKGVYLLDVPKLYMDEFWEVIRDVPTLVLHACGEDLGIYYLLSKLPPLDNVFDTQIALGFLVGESAWGYQRALAKVLGIHVDKGESQSDWLQRPLTFEQEQYAADDVRYLLALHDAIAEQLAARALLDYAREDCQSYAREVYDNINTADDALYLSVADFRDSPQQLALLQALCEWREELARSLNRPRAFILRPQTLREIVEKPPHSIKQLSFTSIKPNVIRQYGQEILALVAEVRQADPANYPATLPPPYRNLDNPTQKAVSQATREYAAKLGMDESVLMRKKWLSELYAQILANQTAQANAQHNPSNLAANLSPWLRGWRQAWAIATLVPILQTAVGQPADDASASD
ncbi:ribonuclease D [Faucicola atlantae]|uniref:Ribonuclease D n=1 Tax=Faucicola atlantae TaxID=34059 RepID=A0A1B8QLP7_9GAMM|nr:HRDC domain-containing protein [Moraxella atlantae]OBX84709.1 ribonuclease D [Moraxella atlantae]